MTKVSQSPTQRPAQATPPNAPVSTTDASAPSASTASQNATSQTSAPSDRFEAGSAPQPTSSRQAQSASAQGSALRQQYQQGLPTGRSGASQTANQSPTQGARSRWTGPILQPGHINEAREQQLLGHPPRARFVPYGSFDPSRPPVVLVHGINDSPGRLEDLASRLHRDGHQVFLAVYDDHNLPPQRSGRQLAEDLQQLRERHYGSDTRLDVVAHSMGGIVSRSMLNELQRPGSMGREALHDPPSRDHSAPTSSLDNVPAPTLQWGSPARPSTPEAHLTPRAGFSSIRMRTLDTPWDGFNGPTDDVLNRPEMALAQRMARGGTEQFAGGAAWHMRAGSEMYDRLYRVPLEGVELQNIAAHQNSPDHVRSVDDLNGQERLQLVRYLLHAETPNNHRMRNFAYSLQQDSRVQSLQRELQREVRAGNLSATDPNQTQAFINAYNRALPRTEGSHTSILNDTNASNDLVDRIVRELHR